MQRGLATRKLVCPSVCDNTEESSNRMKHYLSSLLS